MGVNAKGCYILTNLCHALGANKITQGKEIDGRKDRTSQTVVKKSRIEDEMRGDRV